MLLVLLLICLLAWMQPGEGIYHTESASWFSQSFKHTEAYFGYSVTYEPTSKRLIVSAPQADRIGEIYSCDLAAKTNKCTSLPKDEKTFSVDPLYNHNVWLGATVKAGPSYFVTCAPLNVRRQGIVLAGTKNNNCSDRFGTLSRCFKYTSGSTEKPTTLKLISNEDRTRDATLCEHAMDSFGWSIDVDDNDIIIGGPAMFTGRAMKYENNRATPIGLTGFVGGKTNIRRVDYNFGYSVVVGKFSTVTNEKSYAVGSPYGKGGYGKVSFYTFRKTKAILNGMITRSKEDLKTDDQFAVGSMFGAVLCAALLTNGSTATTLLVGAPAYASSLQRYNQGAVYFYAPASKLPLKTLFRKIVGIKDDGFFGSAIARLGDYNGDGLDEIAIAAPYENRKAGAVYIYSSADITSKKTEITWVQRIVPELSAGIVLSFGLSLTAVQDYDENGCNELAIGAPQSDKVMLLKCIASVTVKHRTEIPKDLSLRKGNPFRTEDHFIFQSCFDVSFPEKPDIIFAHINVSVQIDHPEAKLNSTDKSYEVFVNRKEKTYCKNITVSAPKNGNYQLPITCRINATLVNPPEKTMVEFNASHVALSDRSVLTSSNIIWLIECEDVNHCKSDLRLTKSISVSPDSPYVIGSPEKVKLAMSVRNEGEAAYGACVRVDATDGVDVASVPRGCERLPARLDALLCRPPGALRKADRPWDIPEIQFDLSHLTSKDKVSIIKIAVDNNCNNQDVKTKYEPVPLKVDASNILIKGITDSGISNAVNMSIKEDDGKAFEHSYTITSGGLTTWVNVEVMVVVQNRSFIEYEQVYMSSDDLTNDQCSQYDDTTFKCVINQLNSKQSAKITVPMKIISPEMLDAAIIQKLNSQFTSLTLKLNEEVMRNSSVTSTFNLGGQVKIWIIVVASLIGLLILLFIFFVLTRCGFFKREKKQKLENVRRSVRRQTMMRKTMMDGVNLQSGSDRRTLLDSVPQETADQAAARDNRLRLDSNATRKK